MSAVEDRLFRIGEVAEQVGVTTRTIRYYEERGLLDRGGDERAKGAHRQYSQADVDRLRELVRMRDLLGLTLEDLVTLAEAEEERAALRDKWHDDPTDAERISIVERALDVAQRQLDLVRTRQHALAEFADEIEARVVLLREKRKAL